MAEQTAVTLNPAFSRLGTIYTAEVPFATTKVTVDATSNITGGAFSTLIDGTPAQVGNEVALGTPGVYVIIVRGANRAGENAVTKDYTITLTKLARVDSSDATLSNITLSGISEDGSDTVSIPLAPRVVRQDQSRLHSQRGLRRRSNGYRDGPPHG